MIIRRQNQTVFCCNTSNEKIAFINTELFTSHLIKKFCLGNFSLMTSLIVWGLRAFSINCPRKSVVWFNGIFTQYPKVVDTPEKKRRISLGVALHIDFVRLCHSKFNFCNGNNRQPNVTQVLNPLFECVVAHISWVCECGNNICV